MDERIIKEGFALLKKQKHYNQATVVRKMNFIGYIVSEATFSKILNCRKVREETLAKAAEGIRELVKIELGLYRSSAEFVPVEEQEWEPTVVGELDSNSPTLVAKPGFAFYENGRLPIQQKVDFFSEARKEVIELGATLRTFTSYFINRGAWEYKIHVESLLEKGVKFKCYLLDPDCNEARLYFDDRKRVYGEVSKGTETIRESIFKLKKIREEFNRERRPGSFEIYTYKHIPYNSFIVVDGGTINGKMMISHYIYGELRANCPVIEFSKNENKTLYKRYFSSLKLLIKDAKKVV